MRKANFTLKKARYMEQTSIKTHGLTFEIGAGSSDEVAVYTDSECIYVFSINYRLEYCGLEIFDKKDGGKVGDMFIQDMTKESFSWILESKRIPSVIRFLSQYIN